MSNPSKTIRYKATSKHPTRTAYFMCENGAAALRNACDCAELKDWELGLETGACVTLDLYYEDVVDGDLYEAEIQETLEKYWTRHHTKFVRI